MSQTFGKEMGLTNKIKRIFRLPISALENFASSFEDNLQQIFCRKREIIFAF